MIDISEEQINLHSPYKVTRIAENSFAFVTDYDVFYNVGFTNDYMLMEEGAYQLFIMNEQGKSSPNDPKVKETVVTIIKEFLNSEPAVVIYICDTSDNRQNIRDRLFTRWLCEYGDENYIFKHEQVKIDDIDYFGSIIMHKSHPLHKEIEENFHEFVMKLPSKLS
jgi:hypothetical protein